MISVGILGSRGRMGQVLIKMLEDHPSCRLSIAGTRENTKAVFEESDVVIDFTTADAVEAHINFSLNNKKPLVIGTTALQEHHHELISFASTQIPLVVSSNMSIGITLLNNFVEKAAYLLDDHYDIEIAELHHRHKKDAPSGTSLMLGKAAASGRGKSLNELQCYHTHSEGQRHQGSIGFSVQRGGAVIGDHSVRFISDEEMIEFSHRSLSRTLYAKGALIAAQWITTQKPGIYSMADVLGL